MKPYEAKQIIKTVFEKTFDKDQFSYFIKNLLKLNEFEGQHHFRQIPNAFENLIEKYERVTKFKDADGNLVDVLIVELKRAHCVEYARSTQRNFIRRYLNGTMGGEFKDAALVAFFSQSSPEEWRFSLIKMQYSLEKKRDEYTPARRFSFLVGERRKSHTAKQQLVGMLKKEEQPSLSDLEAAFNIESVTNEFFEAYKKLVIDVTDELVKIRKKDNKVDDEFNTKNIDSLDFAKKLLGQIVFIYFLQKKGWLGLSNGQKYGEGDQNFLRSLFSMKLKNENFFNDYLEWLFYDALSRKRVTDFYPRFQCRIPFLNGGLFDPIHFYDWEKTDIKISNELFTNHKPSNEDIGTGILDVFDRYNFTVKEDEPLEKEVAVDPEMLGKVFERMLEVKERKSKGAFYTPREIVHYMSQESLIQYLDTALNDQPKSFQRLGDDQTKMFGNETKKSQSELLIENKSGVRVPKADIEKFIKHGEIIIEKDTAIQQGKLSEKSNKFEIPESIRKNAQLIDEKLTDIRVCDPAVGSGAFPVGVMYEIVKARSTLARILNPDQEPNVYGFKQHAIHHCLYGVDIDASAVEICKLRLWLSLVVDETRIDVIEPLPNLDFKIVRGNSLLGYPYKPMGLEEIERLKEDYFNETNKERKIDLKDSIDAKIANLFKNTEKTLGYEVDFDFKVNFSEVFKEKNGFDLVIGNPPYIKEYTDRNAFDGLHNSPYYKGKMDLWYFFGSIGLDILHKNGIETYIAPNNWITNAGASKFRNKILSDSKFLEFIDFGNYQIFEKASIQTMVYLLKKEKNNSVYYFKYSKLLDDQISFDDLDKFLKKTLIEKQLYYIVRFNNKDFINHYIEFIPKKHSIILDKIKSGKKYLHQSEIAQGIVCPQDFLNRKNEQILKNKYIVGTGIFVLSQKEKYFLKLTEKENELIKPYFTTEELKKYWGNKKNKYWIIYGKSDMNKRIKKFPHIKNHLDKFKKIITSDFGPYGLHRARDEKFFKGEKIVSLRKCIKPQFTLSDFDCYVSQTFFIIKSDRFNLKFLAALFNSTLIEYWLFHKGKRQGNNFQIDKEPLMNIPIKEVKNSKQFQIIIDYLLSINGKCNISSKNKLIFSFFEHLIDGMVFELYFEEEIKRAGQDILKHLTNLTPITDDMSDEQKLHIITSTFNELSNPNHPVRQNLDGMDDIEEVRIIKGVDK